MAGQKPEDSYVEKLEEAVQEAQSIYRHSALLAYHPVQRNGIFSNVPIQEWSAMVFSGFPAFPTDGII